MSYYGQHGGKPRVFICYGIFENQKFIEELLPENIVHTNYPDVVYAPDLDHISS